MHIIAAAPINEETSAAIVEHMTQFGLNVADDIDDIEYYYAQTGETGFAVVSIFDINSNTKQATFTVVGSDHFHATWEVQVDEKHGPFYQIKKI